MMQKKCRMRLFATAVAVWGMVFAGPTAASEVTVQGSFGAFEGPVGYSTFFESFINNTLVEPTAPTSRPGVGIGSLTFAPGTSSIDFYNTGEAHNLLQFTAAPAQNVVIGQEFLIGTFTLQNGSWFGGLGEGDSFFSFTATTSSLDPVLTGHTFSDSIRYHITQGAPGNTPQQNADYFWFDAHPELGSMSVYEAFDSPTGSNIGSLDLYGRIGSLIPTRFANAQGGVFVGPAVPEPSACLLMIAGLGLVGFAVRHKRFVAPTAPLAA